MDAILATSSNIPSLSPLVTHQVWIYELSRVCCKAASEGSFTAHISALILHNREKQDNYLSQYTNCQCSTNLEYQSIIVTKYSQLVFAGI
jgi:hypothetical protein